MASEEGDEITRRAEDLRREAERLAREAALLREGAKAGEEKEALPGKEGEGRYPQGYEQTGGSGASPLDSPLSDVFFAYDQSLLSEEAQRIL
ncbi:MAG: hypothetical protein QHH30_11205, partial [candidate division NC10 bacterium]|nr:hypothetical protein [candidate division NC10 bacterium]